MLPWQLDEFKLVYLKKLIVFILFEVMKIFSYALSFNKQALLCWGGGIVFGKRLWGHTNKKIICKDKL